VCLLQGYTDPAGDCLARPGSSASARDRIGSSQGGLGLGLAIVKHLVELHGGQVTAHSEGPNTGATFVVGVGDGVQLDAGFRQRHVQARLAMAHPVEQELERERRLPRARIAFDEVHPVPDETADEKLIEAGNAASA
jgi:hypothetical protein